jgi:hypothetical protein
MTALVTTAHAVGSSDPAGLIAVLTLLALLVGREFLTARATPANRPSTRALDIAIIPLLFILAAIVLARVLSLSR